MQTYTNVTVDILMSALNDMLSTHPSPECVSNDSFNSKDWNSAVTATKKNALPHLLVCTKFFFTCSEFNLLCYIFSFL